MRAKKSNIQPSILSPTIIILRPARETSKLYAEKLLASELGRCINKRVGCSRTINSASKVRRGIQNGIEGNRRENHSGGGGGCISGCSWQDNGARSGG